MTATVRLALPADLEPLRALRHEVFVVGQGVPPEREHDALDAVAEFAVALVGGAVVGTGRLVDGRIDVEGRLEPGTVGTVGTIGRMAVRDGQRGAGVGRAVLDLLVGRAVQRGLPRLELHAQLPARSLYERAGFVVVGDPYLEAGLPHVGMARDLRSG